MNQRPDAPKAPALPTALHPDVVRRNSLRSVSAVCERAAKTAHTLLPSSSRNRTHCVGLRFRIFPFQKKLAALRFRLSAKTAHPLLPSSSRNRTHCVGLRFRFFFISEETRCAPFPISGFRKIPGNAAAANGTRSAAAAYVLIRSLLPRNCPSCRLSRHGRF